MENISYPKLILPDNFDERAKDEALLKGYLNGAKVQLANGELYSVYFIEPGRLAQDLEAETELGRPYLAEPGMIVVPEITMGMIERVVNQLDEDGFFRNLKSSNK